MSAKRNPELDREAQQWIETIIGEKFPSGSYDDALKDGIILCKYVLGFFFFLYKFNQKSY
jgi:hypothetical protein